MLLLLTVLRYKPDPLAVEGGWDTGGEMTDGSTRDVSWKELSDAETTSKSTSTSKSKGKGKAKVVGSTSKPIDVSKITDEQAEALWGEETQEPWGEPYVPPKSPGISPEYAAFLASDDLIML